MGTEIAVRPEGSFAVTPAQAAQQLREVEAVFREVMKKDEHYGVIPGTGKKPTLLKPGAELLCNMYQYRLADLQIVEKIEQWEVPISEGSFPLFRYLVKAVFHDKAGNVIATGMGECNSFESKYRWRESKRLCPVCGSEALIKEKAEYVKGRAPGWMCWKKKGGCGQNFAESDPDVMNQATGREQNQMIHDQINTLVKMAKKRAYVDGALSATRTSGMFTQDMEDFAKLEDVTATTIVEPAPQQQRPDARGQSAPPPNDAARPGVDGPGNVPPELPSEHIVPVGLYKGQDLREMGEKTLTAIYGVFKDSKMLQHQYAAFWGELQKRQADPAFGGIFDGPPDDRKRSEQDRHAELMVQVRQLFEGVIPTFNSPKPRLNAAERRLAARLSTQAFYVDSWDKVRALSVDELGAGLNRLAEAIDAIPFDERDALAKSSEKAK